MAEVDPAQLVVTRGHPFTLAVRCYTDTDATQPRPFEPGDRVVFQVRRRRGSSGDPELAADSDAGDGLLQLEPADDDDVPQPGLAMVSLGGEDTEHATAGQWRWALELILGDDPTSPIDLGSGPMHVQERDVELAP